MTVACIPTIGESPYLDDLIEQLKDHVDEIVLLVNSSETDDTLYDPRPGVAMWNLYGSTIYAEWNAAIDYARSAAHRRLLLLNDDISFEVGALTDYFDLWDTDPTVTLCGFARPDQPGSRRELARCHGTYRNGGISGWAFGLDVGLLGGVRVDEQFEWWFGDDDLVAQINQAGGITATALGCVVHHDAETTARHHAWTYAARVEDHRRYVAKYGTGG